MAFCESLFFANKPIFMESDGNYTKVIFENGETHLLSYCQKELRRRFGVDLIRVNRKVSVKKENVSAITEYGVLFNRKMYKYSRRMKSNWLILLLFVSFMGKGQNVAPIAVNDTLKVCNDVTTSFNVFRNDSDPNGDRLILAAFNNASAIDVIAMGNTGSFRLNGNGDVGTFDFGYTVKDLRFANIGSRTATARVFISTSSPYTYVGNYTTTNIRTACRSSTSGTVTIANNARETITVDTYGELLPGTTIAPSGTGVFELKVKR